MGLSAMQEDVTRQGMRLLRPWLDIDRKELVAIAQEFGADAEHLLDQLRPFGVVAELDPGPEYFRGFLGAGDYWR